MATDTFLEMVSDVITETGYNAGNPPSTIAGATGDAAKVVYWVRVADLQIQRERIDWDFLWAKPTVQLSQGSNLVPAPAPHAPLVASTATGVTAADATNATTALINRINKKSLAIIDSNGEAHFPCWMGWREFSTMYDYEAVETNDKPGFWSMSPDRAIKLSTKMESSGLTCKYEYWRKPIRLRADGDTSRIPDDFSRLIVVLSQILYAGHEDAPEVEASKTAEYELLLNQMLSVHAPDSEWSRMQAQDEPLEVVNT